MNTYHIYVDGIGYAGESDESLPAQVPAFRNGWSGAGPATASGVAFGEPRDIVGLRNLSGHVERVLRLCDAERIEIVRVGD